MKYELTTGQMDDIVYLTRKLMDATKRRDAIESHLSKINPTYRRILAEVTKELADAYDNRAHVLGKIHKLQNEIGVQMIYANAGTQQVRDEQSRDHHDAISERMKGDLLQSNN